MSMHQSRLGIGGLSLGSLLAFASASQAQVNPYFISPQQYWYNMQMARYYNPGYSNGLNGVGAGVNPYTPFVSAGVSPYQTSTNPYTPGGGIYGANPYDTGAGNPYNPFFYGSGLGATGGSLYGSAEMAKAFGNVITSQEQARIMRQQAMQAAIDTQRKRFDFELYKAANTPTYTEEQMKIARQVHKRILSNSSPSEILNGTALNILLDDARKYPNKKVSMDPIPLSEDILRRLNVTAGLGNMGLLRDDGKVAWPAALQDMMTDEQRRTIETLAQNLMTGAKNGKVDANALRDLGNTLDKTQANLVKKVNEIPTIQYLEGKRFIREFNDARVALERGEAKAHFGFQDFVQGGKTIQEVVDYLVSRGLKLAPATSADEGAYRAFHSALVAFDVALNTQAGTTAPETKEAP
ncbi:MAG: hypothetical protein U0744_01465 [Gemmataceae bacterium]